MKEYKVRMELTVIRYVYVTAEDEDAAIDLASDGQWHDEDGHDADMTDWKALEVTGSEEIA